MLSYSRHYRYTAKSVQLQEEVSQTSYTKQNDFSRGSMARNIVNMALPMTVAQLRELETDMFTTVFVGNSQTRELGGHMVTPRGYRL